MYIANNKYKKYGIILILVLIMFSMGCIEFDSNEERIAAHRAKEITDEYVSKLNESYIFVQVRSGSVNEHGLAKYWFVVYSMEGNIGDLTDTIELKVYSDGEVIEIPRSNSRYVGDASQNWVIDSSEAVSISRSNSTVKRWLSEYDDGDIERIGLGLNKEFSDNPIWVINWSSWGLFDDPKHLRVILDAHTGEVIEVDADE